MPEFPEERMLAIVQLILPPGMQERAGKKGRGAPMHEEKWEKNSAQKVQFDLFVHLKRGGRMSNNVEVPPHPKILKKCKFKSAAYEVIKRAPSVKFKPLLKM